MSVRDTGVDVEDRAEGAPTGVIDLECCGLKVMVRSNSQFALRWLCEFHYRASEDTVDASPAYVVQLIIDPDAFQAMRDTGPRVNGRMDTFLRHGRFERLALWRDDDQSRVLFDDRATSFIRVWKRRRAIDILASEDGRDPRVTTMRVVRELATSHLHRRGDVLLHAAAVEHGGRGVVICGEKRAGKTSMLLNALTHDAVGFVANDRVVIRADASGFEIREQPTIVRIRRSCLPILTAPSLADWEQSFHYSLTAAEARDRRRTHDLHTQECFSMSPAQFCRWRRVERARQAKLAALVFPRVDPDVESFELTRLDRRTAAARIQSGLFSGGRLFEESPAFALSMGRSGIDARDASDSIEMIAASCAAFDCRLGPRAYEEPNVWPAIWAALSNRSNSTPGV